MDMEEIRHPYSKEKPLSMDFHLNPSFMSLVCVNYGMNSKLWLNGIRAEKSPELSFRFRYEDGNLVENLNDTTSLTYESMKPTTTSR